jgi:hypothetical protein
LKLWNVTGYITWKLTAAEFVYKELDGCTPRLVASLMHEHVEAGGEIDQVKETRPEWLEYEFHYDFRITVNGRRVYIETVFLMEDDLEDCTIRVVSMHDA